MSAAIDVAQQPNSDLKQRHRLWLLAFMLPCLLGPLWSLVVRPPGPSHFISSCSGMVLILVVGAAAVTDLSRRKIYNWATYPGLLWALAFNAWASLAGQVAHVGGSLPVTDIGIGASLLGGVLCFVPMIMLRQMTGGGAGDVKLATVIGALVGVETGLKIIVTCYIIGGACVLSKLIWDLGPITIAKWIGCRIGSVLLPGFVAPPTDEQKEVLRRRMALGPYFAVATIVVLSGLDMSWNFTF